MNQKSDNSTAGWVFGALFVLAVIYVVAQRKEERAERQHVHDVYGPALDRSLIQGGAPAEEVHQGRSEYERQYGLKPYNR